VTKLAFLGFELFYPSGQLGTILEVITGQFEAKLFFKEESEFS